MTVRRLLRELTSLAQDPPEGIRICKETFGGASTSNGGDGNGGEEQEDGQQMEETEEGEADLSNVRAWVRGIEGTPFEGGYFKVRFTFTSDYPASPPSCAFITKIFHPNVNPSDGSICVSTLKKDWSPEYTISHILVVIKSCVSDPPLAPCPPESEHRLTRSPPTRRLLIHPNPTSALHAEAGRLLLEAYDDFSTRAKLWTDIHAVSKNGPPTEFNVSSSPLKKGVPKESEGRVVAPVEGGSNSFSSSSSTAPLLTSTFENTVSASAVSSKGNGNGVTEGGKPMSAGKKRSASNIASGAVEEVKKVVVPPAKKRGLRRL